MIFRFDRDLQTVEAMAMLNAVLNVKYTVLKC